MEGKPAYPEHKTRVVFVEEMSGEFVREFVVHPCGRVVQADVLALFRDNGKIR